MPIQDTDTGEGIRTGTPNRYPESVLRRGADAALLNEDAELRSTVRAVISCEEAVFDYVY